MAPGPINRPGTSTATNASPWSTYVPTMHLPAVAGTAHAATGSQGVVVQADTEAERTFLERARQALESAARNYKDRGSESLHGFADHAMAVGGDTALAGGATAAVGAGLSATGIGAPVGVPVAAVGAANRCVAPTGNPTHGCDERHPLRA
jgi:hypothetical protein